ncbi:AraC family transcriptional regulator [Dyadobacter luteus]|uniref:AraC family transcriptional regulator n=1 Tax=Dyadobacter luteus TaxID=2259619 RepID=A0A3D8YA16_9BACT|nr:helix-turn-helix domain-containing protein [Dyadobacter luteus]REA58541.1 AraC family transcriptional regulator [Dyadobacter luteus]
MQVETKMGLSNTPIFIRNLDNCPPSYLDDPGRKEFFEIVWLKNENALHTLKGGEVMRGDWIYLIPPYRVHQLNKAGKKGVLLSFKRDFLDEDVKEFLLDVFKIFNIQGEFSCLRLDLETAEQLAKVYEIMEEEYERENSSTTILKALLKVFLLQLVRIKEQDFTVQDINQKRVYEFMVLLEMNYQQVRNTDFYAGKLGISSKRLNQILKEKLDKTGMQLIHDRIVLEAKRQIIHSESTIKEIAYDLGFKDRPYFSRFFKQHTGQSPEQFQNEAKAHIVSKHNTLV